MYNQNSQNSLLRIRTELNECSYSPNMKDYLSNLIMSVMNFPKKANQPRHYIRNMGPDKIIMIWYSMSVPFAGRSYNVPLLIYITKNIPYDPPQIFLEVPQGSGNDQNQQQQQQGTGGGGGIYNMMKNEVSNLYQQVNNNNNNNNNNYYNQGKPNIYGYKPPAQNIYGKPMSNNNQQQPTSFGGGIYGNNNNNDNNNYNNNQPTSFGGGIYGNNNDYNKNNQQQQWWRNLWK